MPNWCENVLQVRGIAAERAEFRRRGGGSVLSLAGHVPPPDPYPPLEAYADSMHPLVLMMRAQPETFDDWYLWRTIHWGCKWDLAAEDVQVIDLQMEDDTGTLEYRFLSPWSPPTPWLHSASVAHPELVFTLYGLEQANDFACRLEVRSGVALSERVESPETMRDELAAVGLEVWEPEIDGP